MHSPLIHFANVDYWSCYNRLPADVRQAADKHFVLLKSYPNHPSLHLRKIGDLWSVRVGLHYRSLGMDAPSDRAPRRVLAFPDAAARRLQREQETPRREARSVASRCLAWRASS
jgi:hypothetical protein